MKNLVSTVTKTVNVPAEYKMHEALPKLLQTF